MADNTTLNAGSGGDTIATDDISGVKYPRSKIVLGANNTNDGDVCKTNGLPVSGNTAADGSGTETRVLLDAAGNPQVDVVSSTLPSGAATSAKQDTVIGHLDGVEGLLTTIDGDTGSIAGCVGGTEVQVDVVAALPAGTNAIGKLAANSGVDIGDVDVTSIAAGDNNIGNVDIVTVPTDPFGANADAASATGSISAKLRFIAATGIPITGTVTVGSHAVTNAGTFATQAQLTPVTSGGLSMSSVIGAATTNATVVKASAGQVYEIVVTNINAAAVYLKLYNKATTPDENDTPVWRMAIPGNTAGAGLAKTFPNGLAFGTGIAYRLVGGAADNNTTAVSASEQLINVGYK